MFPLTLTTAHHFFFAGLMSRCKYLWSYGLCTSRLLRYDEGSGTDVSGSSPLVCLEDIMQLAFCTRVIGSPFLTGMVPRYRLGSYSYIADVKDELSLRLLAPQQL